MERNSGADPEGSRSVAAVGSGGMGLTARVRAVLTEETLTVGSKVKSSRRR